MSWGYKVSPKARKQLRKLGHDPARKIVSFLKTRITGCDNPTKFGKPLKADLSGLWRYRVDDYCIICQLEDDELIVLVVKVGHRRDIYE